MDSLRLPIDSRTLEKCVSSRRLEAIELDGSLQYEEPKSTSTALAEKLKRVWDEYPNGIIDLTESKLEGLDPAAPAIEAKESEEEDEEEEPHDRSQLMIYHDMQKLRDALFDQLNTARNELWFALELSKTLGASSNFTIDAPPLRGHSHHKKPRTVTTDSNAESKTEPPILPAGSYTATPSSLPVKSQQARIIDMELSLAAKHQALDECSGLIDSAVEELEVMADAGGRFWRDLRQLKNGQGGKGRWAVVPRPDFARTMTEGEKAKDVVIPYAVDEAPVQLRTRCLAAFDLDPAKEEPLSFGARTHRRLIVSVLYTGRADHSTLPTGQETSIDLAMENAQLEALDEELYHEIRNEIARHANGEVDSKHATIKMGEMELVFELCDIRDTSFANTDTSPLCDLIVHASRLSLLQIHRRRKARLVGQAVSGMSLLQPILQILQYQSSCETVRSVLDSFSQALGRAGLSAHVEALHSASNTDGILAIEKLLAGEDCLREISVIYKLEVEHCHGIAIDVLPSGVCRITTSRANLPIQDLDDLSGMVADDLNGQLLSYAESFLVEEVDGVYRSRLFKDDLENVIRIEPDSALEIAIRSSSGEISASVIGSISSTYNSESPDLPDWLRALAMKVNASM